MTPEHEQNLMKLFDDLIGLADGDVFPKNSEAIKQMLTDTVIAQFRAALPAERAQMYRSLLEAMAEPPAFWHRLAGSYLFPFEFDNEPAPLLRWLAETLKQHLEE